MSSAAIGMDPHHERLDMSLVEKAIREDWPISLEVRKRAIDRCVKIINDEGSKDRAVLSATRTLASLYKLNLAATQMLMDNKPQVVVVNNNTNNVDTLSQVMANFKDPGDAQKFLELLGKSGYQPANNADASKSTEADSGSSGRS